MFKKGIDKAHSLTVAALRSKYLTYTIIFLFAFQAIWIAFSAYHPMPFDEHFHFRLVDLYSEQYLPFIKDQPSNFASLGDVTRRGSYLSHYLMSFPYRLISIIVDSLTIKIIFLRLINIGMVVTGLFFFVKLFREQKIPRSVINTSFLVLTSIPIFSLLAAHISYDNFLFAIAPLLFLYAWRVYSYDNNSVKNTIVFLILSIVAILIKYTVIPVVVVLGCIVLLGLYKNSRKSIIKCIKKELISMNKATKYSLFGVLTVCILLLAEVYGVNIVRYRSLTPKCNQVQAYESCMKSFVFMRSERLKKETVKLQPTDPARYTIHWADAMVNSSVAVGANTSEKTIQAASSPLILFVGAWGFLSMSILVVAYFWRELWQKNYTRIYSIAFFVYSSVLWAKLYRGHLSHGKFLAIQPRYFLFLMPMVLVITMMAWAAIYKKRRKETLLLSMVVLLLVLSQGGGLSTYIMKSNYTWYFQQPIIIKANENLKKIIGPLFIEN